MLDPITFWYGVACLAVLGFTFWSRKVSPAALQCAIMLTAAYVATNLLNRFIPYPDCFKPYAPINLICGAFASYWLLMRPQMWSLALSLSFLIMTGLDTAFAVNGGYTDYGQVADYVTRQNTLFTVQLFIVLVPGTVDGLGRLGRHMLPDPRWRRFQRLMFWRTDPTKEG